MYFWSLNQSTGEEEASFFLSGISVIRGFRVVVIVDERENRRTWCVSVDVGFILLEEVQCFQFEDWSKQLLVSNEDISFWDNLFDNSILDSRFRYGLCSLIEIQFLTEFFFIPLAFHELLKSRLAASSIT